MSRWLRILPLIVACAFALSGCAWLFSSEPLLVAVPAVPSFAGAHSQSTVFGGMLFTAGISPGDPADGVVVQGDITAQTHRTFDSLEAILKGAGCTLKDVVMVSVYLADIDDLGKMNETMAARFGPNKPARTATPVGSLPGFARLEVDVVARLPR